MSKKAAKPQKEVQTYTVGDPVLGKVRGYPPWPGIVVDPSEVPPAVLSEQPTNKTGAHYCVLFFPKGDYSWLPSKELSKLQNHEIDAFLADETKKRNGDLREGYKIARNPQAWMAERQEAIEAEKEERDDAQIDELESGGEDDEGSSKKAKSKKRKRESDAEPSKTTKKAPKSAKAAADPTKKKATSTKGRKNGKSKAAVESEDDEGDKATAEGDEDAGPSKASPPPAKKAKHDKDEAGDESKDADAQSIKVRDWRHKLQKTFLSNKAPPKAEAMPDLDELFTIVEQYEGMTIEQLQFSKIGKVMRHIASLNDDKVPPRDDEFKFRARAKGLVEKWHQILNANKVSNGSPNPSGTSAANGKPTSAEEKKDTEDVTKSTEKLDLNEKGATSETSAVVPPAPEGQAEDEQDAPAEADTSILGDVTMSEAA